MLINSISVTVVIRIKAQSPGKWLEGQERILAGGNLGFNLGHCMVTGHQEWP